MKITIEIPDGDKCNSDCPFFIEETPEYQQFCSFVKTGFKGKSKLTKCPGKEEAHSSTG
jgi:hypothetical protein